MSRGQYNCGGYFEKHHIIPKCKGGTNNIENIIHLYPREHYEAHMLLALENPHDYKLNYAWFMMSNAKNKYEVSTIEMEKNRISWLEIFNSDENKEWRRKRNSEYWSDPDNRKKISIKRKAYLDTHPEAKEYLSFINSGERSHMYGKTYGKHPCAKSIVCIETGEVFSCEKEAEAITGISRHNICAVLKKKRNCAGVHPETNEPLHWAYADEIDSLSEDDIYLLKVHSYKHAVYCPELDQLYMSPSDAQKYTGIKASGIWNCSHHKKGVKSAGKHPRTGEKLHWVLFEELDPDVRKEYVVKRDDK